ncbi:MAG: serine/threonine protein kinase [Myxococcales bacterium]|nr:serine/threonine protein kinase [Myxococcales bacterium]MCB9646647.1 serine/threonine protein kinase [Deltaproteobacteria bacterium]
MAATKLPDRIRDYVVTRLLGKGGMGEVFLADHPLLLRHVAIKRFVFAAGKGDDEDTAQQRFLREGQALARLTHHNIVQVHDLFEHKKQTFMVLEYVDGFDLSALLGQGALPVDVACIIALKVAEALEHAHFTGIVHRDVKASNVMMSRQGDVKLMDFGIAKQDLLDPMTRTGMVVGTPIYVAPEVLAGGDADARSDLYALGTLMYLMLSGRRPFEHANSENLFALILSGRYPRLGKVAKHVPWRLRSIVQRLMEKKPDKRFTSAAELRQTLEVFLAEEGVAAHHAERLVRFLESQGKLTQEEVTRWLEGPAEAAGITAAARPTRRWGRWAFAAVLLAGVGAAVWFGVLDGLLGQWLAWAESLPPR